MARDHGVSRATAYRYLEEVITVLANQAPDLHESLDKSTFGFPGKPTNMAASFKLSRPRTASWVSDVEPGSVHDLTAARRHVLGALYAAAAAGLPTLADGGYAGAGIGVHTPIKQPTAGQVLDADNRTHNALLRGLRCLGERGFAVLTGRWRALHHITASPSRTGEIVKAALVLTHFEQGVSSRR